MNGEIRQTNKQVLLEVLSYELSKIESELPDRQLRVPKEELMSFARKIDAQAEEDGFAIWRMFRLFVLGVFLIWLIRYMGGCL